MIVERQVPETSVVDILDRVLDKGIVIDAWLRMSVIGIQLISVEMRIVVASIDTYLKNSEFICATPLASPLESHHLTH
jgi:gas vesicle structural protein